jgi:hypothetical protein
MEKNANRQCSKLTTTNARFRANQFYGLGG